MTSPPAPVAADPRAGRVGFGIALVVVAAGLTYLGVAPQHWLRGLLVVAGGLVFAGLYRWFLPDRQAGPLFIRRRWFDGTCYVLLGGAVALFGIVVK